ncbi:restriction endonuclease [Maribacter sp. 1_MG-2023]|uniref:5-methylcytosine restriction system specificity protein McrC n=1 Tax=Maribacter sp. 1_MG-2023 TaxID=3062677 RepID=UPI0026E464A6|nr:restriction endonuclease [Maribacter sp. 1_MG-2023]MDO6472156.1 restriction endonuclease [Maribacter sp. 1_MG-2023]
MIVVNEHYGYNYENSLLELSEEQKVMLQQQNFSQHFQRSKNTNELCFDIQFNEEDEVYRLNSSYIVGVNWIVKGKLPIYIKPKLNNDISEVNYLLMLFEALKETENIKHLDNLYSIDFNAPLIQIEQQQDILSPLLILEFLTILKQIVKKGLKKSYYDVTQNLNTRVKGKVLVNASVKKNHTKSKMHFNYCKYQEFGYNSIENRLLKRTLEFAKAVISNHKTLSTESVKYLINYISPAFTNVSSEISLKEVTNLKHNPFFKEYKSAVQISKIILKRFSYNISQVSETKYKTPPFWIDMPKLFELYLFKKLKEVFPLRNEVIYHKKFHSLEPDILLNSKCGNFKVVIDAKYKPRYEEGKISHKDAAQVSGYGRLKSIRKELKIENDNLLTDTLIIYTSNNSKNSDIVIDELLSQEDKRYLKLYKYSIQIPVM